MGPHRVGLRRRARWPRGPWAGRSAARSGSLAPAGRWRDVAALVLLAAALGVDVSPLRRRLPTTRRQVNEDWMGRYRGWVYGAAFGAQLGSGVATIVTSAAVYAAVLGAVLCGTAAAGAAVGAAFGATRALSLLPARRAADPASLVRLHHRLGRAQAPAGRAALAAEAAAIALVVVALL